MNGNTVGVITLVAVGIVGVVLFVSAWRDGRPEPEREKSMSEIEYLTVGELIKELEHVADTLGEDTPVLIAGDPEGNSHYPYSCYDEMIADAAESLVPGRAVETIYNVNDPYAQDIAMSHRVIVLCP